MNIVKPLVLMLVLMLPVCPAVSSQDRGASPEASLFKGWTFDVARILDISYSEGNGSEKFEFDVQMRGPMLGFAIHF